MLPLSTVVLLLGDCFEGGIVIGIGQLPLEAIGLELPQKGLVFGHAEILFKDGNHSLAIVNLKGHSVVNPRNDIGIATLFRII